MSNEPQDDWRTFYRAALLEVDSAKLRQRIDQAYKALQTCMNADGHSADERHAQADALANLRVLRNEVNHRDNVPYVKEPEASASGQE